MLRKRSASTVPTRLAFDHVALIKSGPTLALSVPAGETVAIVGPAGAGKSHLIRCVRGEEKLEQGQITAPNQIVFPHEQDWGRREKPQSIAKSASEGHEPSNAAEVLTSLGLWEVRSQSCQTLSQSQQVAAQLIQPLCQATELLVLDDELDRLDPWALESTWTYLRKLAVQGTTSVFATNRPEIAERCSHIIVLRAQQVCFSGTPAQLLRRVAPTEVVVSTDNIPGVKALAEPFEVTIEEHEGSIKFLAAEGQQLAAKLLLEGYNDVRFLTTRTPKFAEALVKLF